MNDYNELVDKVIKWAGDRGIFDQATPMDQWSKLLEEVGELAVAIHDMDEKGLVDAIGDIQVCLIIITFLLDLCPVACLESAYNEIKDRKGRMVNGVFVKAEE